MSSAVPLDHTMTQRSFNPPTYREYVALPLPCRVFFQVIGALVIVAGIVGGVLSPFSRQLRVY
jgi:hypothetical protein